MFHLMYGIIFIMKIICLVLSSAATAQFPFLKKKVLSYSASFTTSKIVQSNIHQTISKYYIRNATSITTQVHRMAAVSILTAKAHLFNTKFAHYLHKQL